ncbi:hypothetical protein H7U19_02485 [Hyunsoonleella sp. SJ7]|uniref:Uncharacterized protein n=1 Tax=Hyunsoonleella aquatilis TaxID=2762758 RepID=A0A923H7F2_9FLAO|nr:hypothetical protein [Hyunsoonleella aquatilis]MBC3757255.1 hypothetical protein [Hyunsoonleella aquatilis]
MFKTNAKLFFTIVFLFLFFGIYSDYIIGTKEMVNELFLEKLTQSQSQEFLESQKKWKYLSYVAVPFLLLIKTSVISVILHAGCFFFERDLSYKKLFNIVVKAEFVFLLVIVFKTLWFYVFQQDYTLEDLRYFYPLSAINIFGYDDLQPWFVYPLQVLNLFEFAYWIILAYLLGKAINENTDKGLTIVASSYGIGLLIWVVAVMFFTLNMS